MSTKVAISDRFRSSLELVEQELVLKPMLDLYLHEARFPDVFEVVFRKAGAARKPDGYFHPSTHPRWTERQLYYYLTEPERMETEVLSYESRMAVTMGTAVHGFVEMCIRDMGIALPLTGICPACHRERGFKKNQCAEYGAADHEVGSRGHMDSEISIDIRGTRWKPGKGVLEFKTTNPRANGGRLADNDLDGFKKTWPDYYDQVQDYMAMSGNDQAIVLVAVLGYPWKLIEIQIPYEPSHAKRIHDKYRSVRSYVEHGIVPDPCCAPRSVTARNCPARAICPIGRM